MTNKLIKYKHLLILPIFLGLSLLFIFPEFAIAGTDVIGDVIPPAAVDNINIASGGSIGAMFFASRLIRFGSIVAGVFVIWNFISAGFTYISSAGNSNAHVMVRDKLTWSIIGIIVIISAYTLAGIFGLIFFDDPTIILNPQIEGAI